MSDPFKHRRSGVLLHPTSLPGSAAQGQLNQEAFNFIDFLHDSKISIWQVLPLGPTHEDDSPYQSYSAFALNPKLLDVTTLKQWHFLPAAELASCLTCNNPIEAVYQLFMACADQEQQSRFSHFKSSHQDWLEDFARYCCIKQNHGNTSWIAWPAPLRDRETHALEVFSQKHAAEIDIFKFEQFVLYTIWYTIKDYAAHKKIAMFGDIPIFVAHDSADVWANRHLFHLDAQGNPITVAGVPPDYFSAVGQRWGNPHYCWQAMTKDDFAWWIRRLAHNLLLYDMVRIDHFRGLESFWEIPAHEATAINGKWVKAPGKKLLSLFQKHFKALPIVAEDLGIITPEVEALRDRFHLPGMKVLQFAFDSDAANPYLPHNHVKCSVVYTGTHDNNTSAGWFAQLDETTRNDCLAYLNYPKEPMPWPLIQSALASVAQIAIIPMQDLLAGGSEQRMNTPGTTQGNWRWRFQWDQLPVGLSKHIEKLNILYGRNTSDSGMHQQ
jgi:4-alpha-glucanotransferase